METAEAVYKDTEGIKTERESEPLCLHDRSHSGDRRPLGKGWSRLDEDPYCLQRREGIQMPFTIDPPKGSNIPDGTYKAQLISVESGIPSKYGKMRKWNFLVDVDGQGEDLAGLTSEATGPGTKAFAWLSALTGQTPQVGATIEDPTGKTVLLDIVANEKGYPQINEMRAFVEPAQVEAGIPR